MKKYFLFIGLLLMTMQLTAQSFTYTLDPGFFNIINESTGDTMLWFTENDNLRAQRSFRLQKRIDLVVSLKETTPNISEDRTGLEQSYYEILGIKVPHIELYVRPGRDLARLVEVAAMVQALKTMGYDPAKEFNDKLIAHMDSAHK